MKKIILIALFLISGFLMANAKQISSNYSPNTEIVNSTGVNNVVGAMFINNVIPSFNVVKTSNTDNSDVKICHVWVQYGGYTIEITCPCDMLEEALHMLMEEIRNH